MPPSADIYNYIYEGKKGGRLDNVIRFNKSWIVKSVRAITMYEVRAKIGDSAVLIPLCRIAMLRPEGRK